MPDQACPAIRSSGSLTRLLPTVFTSRLTPPEVPCVACSSSPSACWCPSSCSRRRAVPTTGRTSAPPAGPPRPDRGPVPARAAARVRGPACRSTDTATVAHRRPAGPGRGRRLQEVRHRSRSTRSSAPPRRSPTPCAPATSPPPRPPTPPAARRGSASSPSPAWSRRSTARSTPRVDDFAGADDPEFTGWHRLEYMLWKQNTHRRRRAVRRPARQRPRDAQDRARRRSRSRRPPWPLGAVRADRGGLRRARSPARRTATPRPTCGTSPPTSPGRRRSSRLLTPALEKADPELLAKIQADFSRARRELDALRKGDGSSSSASRTTSSPTPSCAPRRRSPRRRSTSSRASSPACPRTSHSCRAPSASSSGRVKYHVSRREFLAGAGGLAVGAAAGGLVGAAASDGAGGQRGRARSLPRPVRGRPPDRDHAAPGPGAGPDGRPSRCWPPTGPT